MWVVRVGLVSLCLQFAGACPAQDAEPKPAWPEQFGTGNDPDKFQPDLSGWVNSGSDEGVADTRALESDAGKFRLKCLSLEVASAYSRYVDWGQTEQGMNLFTPRSRIVCDPAGESVPGWEPPVEEEVPNNEC